MNQNQKLISYLLLFLINLIMLHEKRSNVLKIFLDIISSYQEYRKLN